MSPEGQNKMSITTIPDGVIAPRRSLARRMLRRAIPTGLRTPLYLFLSRGAFGRIAGLVYRNRIPYRGLRILTHNRLVTPVVKALLCWGFYEEDEASFVARSLAPNLDVVELGASLGVVSCLVARKLDADRRVVSVEALPELLALARANAEENGLDSRIRFVQGAISYGSGDLVAFEADDMSLCGRLAAESAVRDARRVEVPAKTLGVLLNESRIGDYALVCDIEGAEAGIIEEDAAALERCRQIIIELHDTTYNGVSLTPADLSARLEDKHGFRLRGRARRTYLFERPA